MSQTRTLSNNTAYCILNQLTRRMHSQDGRHCKHEDTREGGTWVPAPPHLCKQKKNQSMEHQKINITDTCTRAVTNNQLFN